MTIRPWGAVGGLTHRDSVRLGERTGHVGTRRWWLVLVAWTVVLVATPGWAATWIVTKTADTADGACDADCSLREAVIAANATPAADTIHVPNGIYVLSRTGAGEDLAVTGDLDLTAPVTIQGRYGSSVGDTIIDGNLGDRVFDVRSSGTAINSVIVTGGSAAGFQGGGIRTVGTNASVVLNDTAVRGNSAGLGGGLFISSGTHATLVRSTFSGNTAQGHGGGVFSFGSLLVHVATFAGNVASGGEGGAINNNSGGTVYLRGSTIAGNAAAVTSGGIANFGVFTLNNTIVAANSATNWPDCVAQVMTPLTSEGYNIVGDATGCTVTPVTGDQMGSGANPIDPLLGPLQDNGGITETRALLVGSPAIDAGNPAPLAGGGSACNWTDQRGVSHSWGTGCDIGAYEVPCGDGAPDTGEACDPGGDVAGDCCSPHCGYESAGTTCRALAGACDVAETCSGLDAACPADGAQADGTDCDDGDACTQTDTCQGGTCSGADPLDCDDGDACSADSCDPMSGCVNDDAPAAGCLTAGKSIVLIKSNASDQSKDKLLWKWIKGAALDQMDLADPTSSDGYALCVYAGTTDALIAKAAIPPGTGWNAIGTKGFKFKGASPDGLSLALLKGGAAGKSKALAKGKGAALPDPTLPLAYPVTVQLKKDGSPLCLESTFTAANEKKNDAGQFKAKK